MLVRVGARTPVPPRLPSLTGALRGNGIKTRGPCGIQVKRAMPKVGQTPQMPVGAKVVIHSRGRRTGQLGHHREILYACASMWGVATTVVAGSLMPALSSSTELCVASRIRQVITRTTEGDKEGGMPPPSIGKVPGSKGHKPRRYSCPKWGHGGRFHSPLGVCSHIEAAEGRCFSRHLEKSSTR